MLHGQPFSVLVAAGNTLLNEVHPLRSVVDIRVERVDGFKLLARDSQRNIVISGAIDISERFEKGFRMPRGQSARLSRHWRCERRIGVARVQLMRLTVFPHPQLVGILLPPRQRALGSIDLDRNIIFPPVRYLGGGYCSQSTVLVSDNGVSVVIQLPSLDKRS